MEKLFNHGYFQLIDKLYSTTNYDKQVLAQEWKQLYSLLKDYQKQIFNTQHDDSAAIDPLDPELERLFEEVIPAFFHVWAKLKLVDRSLFNIYVALQKAQDDLQALLENGMFTRSILESHAGKLEHTHQSIQSLNAASSSENDFKVQGKEILVLKHGYCKKKLDGMMEELAQISPALVPIHTRLVEIKTELAGLLSRNNPHAFSLTQVQVLQEAFVIDDVE